MKRSKRIQSIVDIKAQQENQALKEVAEQQQKTYAAQQQLEHLEQYRQGYLDRDKAGGAQRVSALLEFRAFIAKLDQAIIGQMDVIRQLDIELQRKRKHWESLHQNTKNLQKVCNGMVAAELKIANKREQLESDDRAARMAQQNFGGMNND
ncbi:MAG: flagellar FliJ family protein [Methylococcaceae bacterium]|nr:flagellar FliJ family protein [Methylococcaceae bacterium]